MQLEDAITFGLAWLGYALLASDFARRARGRRDARVSALTALVAIVHVACVYVFRFDGSVLAAWQKSAAGFVIFHSALLTIVLAPMVFEPWRTRMVFVSFGVVSFGGLGAPFRYPELGVLAIPLFTVFGVALVFAWRGRKIEEETHTTSAKRTRRKTREREKEGER